MILSCDSNNHTRTYHLPKEKINNIQAIEQTAKISELTWEQPNTWQPSEGSSMRMASYSIPYSGGAGDLSVIQLAGTGGGLEPNVNRWRRQLNLEPLSLIEIEKNIIEREGKLGIFNMIQIINEKTDTAFLCAILNLPENTIFVKLSLKPNGIPEVKDEFIIFCSSFNWTN